MKKRSIIIAAAVVAAILIIFYIAGRMRSYSDFFVVSSTPQNMGTDVEYEIFDGNILAYGSDGISCMGLDNSLLWNQSYEIEQPLFDMSGEYALVAEEDGNRVFIFNKEGYVNHFETGSRILKARISAEGTVALVLEKKSGCALERLNQNGDVLAEGEVHIENSGYPLGLDISEDGKTMAVSLMSVSSGATVTKVNFYNFGEVGTQAQDNIVATYSYDNTLSPDISFFEDGRCVLVGDTKAVFYSAGDTPQEITIQKFADEIRSVVIGDNALGVVYQNNDMLTELEESSDALESSRSSIYTLDAYDTNGRQLAECGFDLDYKDIEFMSNGEICVRGEKTAEIFSTSGAERFRYNFEEGILKIIPIGNFNDYIFVYSDRTDRVRLQ